MDELNDLDDLFDDGVRAAHLATHAAEAKEATTRIDLEHVLFVIGGEDFLDWRSLLRLSTTNSKLRASVFSCASLRNQSIAGRLTVPGDIASGTQASNVFPAATGCKKTTAHRFACISQGIDGRTGPVLGWPWLRSNIRAAWVNMKVMPPAVFMYPSGSVPAPVIPALSCSVPPTAQRMAKRLTSLDFPAMYTRVLTEIRLHAAACGAELADTLSGELRHLRAAAEPSSCAGTAPTGCALRAAALLLRGINLQSARFRAWAAEVEVALEPLALAAGDAADAHAGPDAPPTLEAAGRLALRGLLLLAYDLREPLQVACAVARRAVTVLVSGGPAASELVERLTSAYVSSCGSTSADATGANTQDRACSASTSFTDGGASSDAGADVDASGCGVPLLRARSSEIVSAGSASGAGTAVGILSGLGGGTAGSGGGTAGSSTAISSNRHDASGTGRATARPSSSTVRTSDLGLSRESFLAAQIQADEVRVAGSISMNRPSSDSGESEAGPSGLSASGGGSLVPAAVAHTGSLLPVAVGAGTSNVSRSSSARQNRMLQPNSSSSRSRLRLGPAERHSPFAMSTRGSAGLGDDAARLGQTPVSPLARARSHPHQGPRRDSLAEPVSSAVGSKRRRPDGVSVGFLPGSDSSHGDLASDGGYIASSSTRPPDSCDDNPADEDGSGVRGAAPSSKRMRPAEPVVPQPELEALPVAIEPTPAGRLRLRLGVGRMAGLPASADLGLVQSAPGPHGDSESELESESDTRAHRSSTRNRGAAFLEARDHDDDYLGYFTAAALVQHSSLHGALSRSSYHAAADRGRPGGRFDACGDEVLESLIAEAETRNRRASAVADAMEATMMRTCDAAAEAEERAAVAAVRVTAAALGSAGQSSGRSSAVHSLSPQDVQVAATRAVNGNGYQLATPRSRHSNTHSPDIGSSAYSLGLDPRLPQVDRGRRFNLRTSLNDFCSELGFQCLAEFEPLAAGEHAAASGKTSGPVGNDSESSVAASAYAHAALSATRATSRTPGSSCLRSSGLSSELKMQLSSSQAALSASSAASPAPAAATCANTDSDTATIGSQGPDLIDHHGADTTEISELLAPATAAAAAAAGATPQAELASPTTGSGTGIGVTIMMTRWKLRDALLGDMRRLTDTCADVDVPDAPESFFRPTQGKLRKLIAEPLRAAVVGLEAGMLRRQSAAAAAASAASAAAAGVSTRAVHHHHDLESDSN